MMNHNYTYKTGICPICGQTFTYRSAYRKYCFNPECRREAGRRAKSKYEKAKWKKRQRDERRSLKAEPEKFTPCIDCGRNAWPNKLRCNTCLRIISKTYADVTIYSLDKTNIPYVQ